MTCQPLPSRKRSALTRKLYRQRMLLLMLLPCFALVLLFSYGPLWGWYLAFVRYKPGSAILGAPWVGLDNFKKFLAQSLDFGKVIRNTLVVNIASLAVSMPCEITLAVILYELRFKRYKRVVQTISYLPYFISWVIVGGVFFQFFSIQGVVNNLLMATGLIDTPIMFLGLPSTAWPMLIFSRLWKNLGWSTIVYLGAMGSIDPSLYEAAYVDGAKRWARIWHITLPGLVPTISVMLILAAGGLINGAFDQVYVFQNPANLDYCDTIDTMVYRMGLQNANFSYATAIGMFNNFVSIILMVLVNGLVKRINGRSLI
ncbi:MAG: ABC transporter permease subunit [Oscillospiraceae bacterium]|jgi:putative aldouronate transport system permease protein|nr:ABC transporter permease subunit [Oscillospiraceae bacterium]